MIVVPGWIEHWSIITGRGAAFAASCGDLCCARPLSGFPSLQPDRPSLHRKLILLHLRPSNALYLSKGCEALSNISQTWRNSDAGSSGGTGKYSGVAVNQFSIRCFRPFKHCSYSRVYRCAYNDS